MKEKSQKRITVVNACAKSVHQSNLLSQNMRLVDNLSTLNKNELLLLTFVASKVKKGDTAFEKLVFKPSILSALLNINLADCKTRARFQRDVINLRKNRWSFGATIMKVLYPALYFRSANTTAKIVNIFSN